MTNKKKKIAVLGGGIGSLSAAFYLTEQEDWAEKYDITVYQQGWRLGGKCASGRDMRPAYGNRIYEHGLHIFAGFYDQSFDLLRRAYEAVDRPDGHPNQTVWDAFIPEDQIALMDSPRPGHPNMIWYMNMPANDARPGDDLGMPPLVDMIEKLVATLLHISPKRTDLDGAGQEREGAIPSLLHKACRILKGLIGRVENEIEEDVFNFALHKIVKTLHAEMRRIHDADSRFEFDVMLERFLKSAFCTQAILHGVVVDRVFAEGFDAIDQYDWSEWIYRNALAVAEKFPEWGDPETRAQELIDWTPIRSMYDYAFALQDVGVSDQRNFAAGTALRAGLLLVSYKGHFFWKMQGGMGDVVVAPIYLALLKRGVKFEFFKRITSVNLDETHDVVSSIDFVHQAELKTPSAGYKPLIRVPVPGWPADTPLDAWPAETLWDQIKDGEALATAGRNYEDDNNNLPGADDRKDVLMPGDDFDEVILGISVGGLKQVCATFPDRLPDSKWGPMFRDLTLTRTCAMQLWFKRSMADLGTQGSGRTLSGADQPYSTWSDMSHLLDREEWNGKDRPRSIAYFCGQTGGTETGRAAHDEAARFGKSWLKSNAWRYWPKALAGDSSYGLQSSLLYDPDPGAGGNPFERQYVRTNYNPSDLYVQSPKGSAHSRMDPGGSGVENLFLAGDWTLSEMNSGCVEGAARSGARCAQALAGEAPGLLKPPARKVPTNNRVMGSAANTSSAYPPYVIDGNLYDSLGAAQLSDVVLHNFCVPASKAKQQAWLDRTFAAPSGGTISYEALSDKIFLGIAELGKVQALGRGLEDKGYTSEIDVTFWILARRQHDGIAKIRWIPAYLFVNSGPVLVTGREVWGFPKQLGRFSFSPLDLSPGGARTFEVEGTVVSPYGPDSQARWAPIIEVRPHKSPPGSHGILQSLEHLAEEAVGRLTGDLLSMASQIGTAIGTGNMVMAFLKQFPDAERPGTACYQAIVEAEAQTTRMRASGLTNNTYEVRVTSYDSMPFLQELGIAPDWHDVGHGMWIDFDFTQELGKEVWRAGQT